MSLLREVGQYLEDESVGQFGVDIKLTFMPNEPSSLIVLYQVPGETGQRVQEVRGERYERPRMQVQVRDESPETSESRANDVYLALARIRNQLLGGKWYLNCFSVQPPYQLERDQKRRVIYTFEVSFLKEV